MLETISSGFDVVSGANLQQFLDNRGNLKLGIADLQPSYPLFLDSGMDISGVGPWTDGVGGTFRGTRLLGYTASPIAVVGWPRGSLSSGHWPGGTTYRTRFNGEDSYLYSIESPWALGPPTYNGWADCTNVVIEFRATLNTGNWANFACAGNQDLIGTHGFGPNPRPWVLYWNNTVLTLYIQTSDGILRTFTFNASYTTAALDIRITINLTAGTVTADNYSTNYTVDSSGAGAGWGAGQQLIENNNSPFALGTIVPGAGFGGYWPDVYTDMTIRYAAITWTTPSKTYSVTTNRTATAITPYPGAAILPIFPTSYSESGSANYLLATLKHQTGGLASNVRIKNIMFQASPGQSSLVTGLIEGGLTIRDCIFNAGSRGISSARYAVNYPVIIEDCSFVDHEDCDIYLHRATNMKIVNTRFNHATRRSIILEGCFGKVDTGIIAPPGPPTQKIAIDQFGGGVVYENILNDNEFDSSVPCPPLIQVTPTSFDQPWFGTGVKTINCDGGYGGGGWGLPGSRLPLIYLKSRLGTYTGPVTIEVNSYDLGDPSIFPNDVGPTSIVGPGLSDSTIRIRLDEAQFNFLNP